ncbi:unnamed protein product [Musa textilis]
MPPHQIHQFDEIQWVSRIRRVLQEELESDDDDRPASISDVPKALLCSQPDAYIPQILALGPYHRHREELHDMERYKLAAARRMQSRLPGVKFLDVVALFIKLELPIRAHYHRYLKFNGETLAWMMALDISFLLEFLQIIATSKGKMVGRAPSRMSHLVGLDRRTSAYNMLLCDALMLENQIPLFLLQKALEMQCSSSQIAAQISSSMLIGFLIEVSPFKTLDISPWIDAGQHAHLLELLYHTVAPNPEELFETVEGDEETEQEPQVYVRVRFFLKAIAAFVFNRGRALVSAVVKFLVTIPWRTIKSIPALSIIAHPVEQLLSSQKDQNSEPARGISTHGRSTTPLLEEIAIPSVTELTKAGVKFSAMNGDISAIEFHAQTATLHLPAISLDVNAEVVLRNLVAYEASIGSRPLIFSRYVELMNGIIDTAEDAKLLREAGVVLNHLKSDEEVAELWNSMTRSVRLTRVPALDRVIEEVNSYHSSRWRVRARRFMKNYVAASWECLVLLAVLLLFFIISVQAFCVLFWMLPGTCHKSSGMHFKSIRWLTFLVPYSLILIRYLIQHLICHTCCHQMKLLLLLFLLLIFKTRMLLLFMMEKDNLVLLAFGGCSEFLDTIKFGFWTEVCHNGANLDMKLNLRHLKWQFHELLQSVKLLKTYIMVNWLDLPHLKQNFSLIWYGRWNRSNKI